MAKQNKKKKAAPKAGTSAKKAKSPLKAKAPAKKAAPKKSAKKTAAPEKKGAAKKKRKQETLMCFLTTACVHYYGLPDNGYELNTLRAYRDKQLAIMPGGKALIQDYYRVSPEIVSRIEKDAEKGSVYEYIYSVVRSACQSIEGKNWLLAKAQYQQMVEALMSRYRLNAVLTQ